VEPKQANGPRARRRLRMERLGRYLLTPAEAAALSPEDEREGGR
jgi:hypothetical protein